MVYIAVFAVLMTVCAWISIPAAVPFTMQTFGVFAAVLMLGGRRASAAILLYILMGFAGLPVFSGFKGGAGVLLGTTGGYIIGFLAAALAVWGAETVLKEKSRKLPAEIGLMVLAMAVYYVFGTVWFIQVYARNTGPVGVGSVLGWCVLPFVIPDCIKMALAFVLTRRLRRHLNI